MQPSLPSLIVLMLSTCCLSRKWYHTWGTSIGVVATTGVDVVVGTGAPEMAVGASATTVGAPEMVVVV